jgi:hypothetical protein
MTNWSLNRPSKNAASPLKKASFACLSRASSAFAVGASAMGLAASEFALLTGGLSAGAPQAAKKTAAMAVHGNSPFLFMILSPPYPFAVFGTSIDEGRALEMDSSPDSHGIWRAEVIGSPRT